MPKTRKVGLAGVLRRHALLLQRPDLNVPRKETAKLLCQAAKAPEVFRGLHWPWTMEEEETCAKT